jgi:UDP-2,4-diacetamido-2,4,6-trideoxy-beta-L-altropyranose hydrolase
MNILVRCDSSNIIGTGHVMRCLNLCDYHPENKYTFVCKNFDMNIISKIKDKGYNVLIFNYYIEPVINDYKTWLGCNDKEEINTLLGILKKTTYDEIIFDHYGIDFFIEKYIRSFCKKVTVITDIFDYKHYCDEFINYNSDEIDKIKEINLNLNTNIKYGISNIIINKKFLQHKKTNFKDRIENICIMMGGCDPQNYTIKVIKMINDIIIINNIKIYIIIGKSNSHIKEIEDYSLKYTDYITILYDLNYDELINLYLNNIDLCIGSLSIAAYERYFLNVPQICLKIVENQNIQRLKEFNICTDIYKIKDIIKQFL